MSVCARIRNVVLTVWDLKTLTADPRRPCTGPAGGRGVVFALSIFEPKGCDNDANSPLLWIFVAERLRKERASNRKLSIFNLSVDSIDLNLI